MSSDALLQIEGLEKSFGGTRVLRGLSLTAARGEFVTLLGPSGCGKTTTMRIVAGLETPDAGRVYIAGRDVTDAAPEKRPVNTVFQNYALFPHMTVAGNIAYGLRVRGEKRAAIAPRVEEMLRLIKLEGYGARKPSELSGGQRQRVAIARAVVLRPDALLLDEPLGALDQKLRQQMQTELKALQKQLGITFLYITHDQEEALNMSDRIAVMREGRFEQVGTPEAIYESPATRFVAGFIGEGALFEGEVVSLDGGECAVRAPEGLLRARALPGLAVGARVAVSVHAERVLYGVQPLPGFKLEATVVSHRYAGSTLRTELLFAGGRGVTVNGMRAMAALPAPGSRVFVGWDAAYGAPIPEVGRA